MKVKDLYQKFSECTDKVKETDSMEKIIEVLFRNKATRTVFVVGNKGKLMGVIRLQEILRAIGKDISLGFVVDSIEQMSEILKKKNIPIHSGPFQPNPSIKFMYMLDPNGIKIQFVENIK